MKKNLLITAGIIVFSLAAAAHQATLLRRELKEDSTDVYKLVSEVKSTASSTAFDGDLSLTSNMKVTLKNGKLDAASGQIGAQATISDIDLKADGSIAQFITPMLEQLPKEMKVDGKLDARNRFAADVSKSPDTMLSMMTGTSPSSSITFVEFPEKPVSVGDTWTFSAPKSPFFGKDPQNLTAKLTGDRDFGSSKVWVISVSGTLKINPDIEAIRKISPNADQVPNMTIKGTADITGEALVDKANGKTLQYTATSAQNSHMEMVDAGMTVDTKGTVKTTMTLQK